MNTIRKNLILSGILFPLLALGCAQTNSSSREPASREQVVENLEPIVKVEERGRMLTMAMQKLPQLMEIRTEDVQKLKEHYDVYYVHHNAATISLAQGNIDSYQGHLKVASAELDSIEERLKMIIKNSGMPPPHG
jgi:hypothetical protein